MIVDKKPEADHHTQPIAVRKEWKDRPEYRDVVERLERYNTSRFVSRKRTQEAGAQLEAPVHRPHARAPRRARRSAAKTTSSTGDPDPEPHGVVVEFAAVDDPATRASVVDALLSVLDELEAGS
jgi:hypothetical protein